MKKLPVYFALLSLFFCMSLFACSKKEEVEPEKGKIDKMTDQAADAIVTKIRTPLDQAQSAKASEDERVKALDEALKEE